MESQEEMSESEQTEMPLKLISTISVFNPTIICNSFLEEKKWNIENTMNAFYLRVLRNAKISTKKDSILNLKVYSTTFT